MGEEEQMLRVHSNDLHQHVMEEVAKCFENSSYTDMVIRCKNGEAIHAHKLVMSAVSPYIKFLLDNVDYEEGLTIELPDVTYDEGLLLVDVIYNGMVEATLDELKSMIILARDLYISIPVSEDLMKTLNIAPMPKKVFILPGDDDESSPKSSLSAVPLICSSQNLKLKEQSSLKRPSDQSQLKLSNGMSLTHQNEIPLPPPLKRIREDLPHLQVLPNRTPNLMLNRNQKEYLCPFCNSKYYNLGNFKQHMKFHESEAAKEDRNQMMNEMVATSFSPESNVYTCEICKSTYSHPGNFKQHLGKHERETGAVSVLYQQKFGLSSPLARPLSTASSVGTKATSNSHLNHALQSSFADRVDNGDTTIKQYHCEICGRTFKHPGNYKQHMASHMRSTTSGPNLNAALKAKQESSVNANSGLSVKFKCGICDEVFNSESNLQQHKIVFHFSTPSDPLDITPAVEEKSGNMFRCDAPGCLQCFSKEIFLIKHKESQHKINSLPINMNLASMISISDQKQVIFHPCKICGKSFSKASKLTAHMKIHSAPEEHYKYPCDICGKKFTRPQHVNRHKRLHTGERPFRCLKCDKAFNREDKLKQHQQRNCDLPYADVGIGHQMEGEDEDTMDHQAYLEQEQDDSNGFVSEEHLTDTFIKTENTTDFQEEFV